MEEERIVKASKERFERGPQTTRGEREGMYISHVYHNCEKNECDPMAHVGRTMLQDGVKCSNRFDRLGLIDCEPEENGEQTEEGVASSGRTNRKRRGKKRAGGKVEWRGLERGQEQAAENVKGEAGRSVEPQKRSIAQQDPKEITQIMDEWREEDEKCVDEYVWAETQQALSVASVAREMEGGWELGERAPEEVPRGTLLWDLIGIGSRWYLVYLDTGCAMDAIIDPAFKKQLEGEGVPMVEVKQQGAGVGLDGAHIQFRGAVKIWVTRGNVRVRLTFAVTKKPMALGAVLGRPGLTKLGWVIDTTDPRHFAIPGHDGKPQRARADPYNYGLETPTVVSVPPGQCTSVFGIGPGLPEEAVGSEAIASCHTRTMWPVANTLTTVRKDRIGRIGAQICISNPAKHEWLVIPRGVPVACLGLHWRKGIVTIPVVPGKEEQGEEILFQPPDIRPVPICPLLREPERGGKAETKRSVKGKEKEEPLPEWMKVAVELRLKGRRADRVKQSSGEWEREREELWELGRRAVPSLVAVAAERGPGTATLLAEVILRYPKAFAPVVFGNAGGANVEPVKLRLMEGAKPSAEPPRRMSWYRREIIRDLVKALLEQGVISPSKSPWSSPIVLTIKQDGSPRMCVDYRKLNSVTERDSFPLPRMDDLLDRLGESACRSTLDLASGYYQIPIAEADKEKTAFAVQEGLYQFNGMPFGLKNGPGVFQRIMHEMLAGIHYIFALCYLDDIIVFSRSLEEHLDHLDQVLQRLAKANLQVKLSKCAFLQKRIKYLGHIVTDEGVEVDPEKTRVVKEAPAPRNKKELQQFLGLVNYFRGFIEDYAEVAGPLYRITGRKVDWQWGPIEHRAFEKLKNMMTSAPTLVFPDPKRAIRLKTDASGYAVGGILEQQGLKGEWRPVAFWSKALRPEQQNYPAVEREALAMVAMVTHFRPYLEGREFELISDAQALQYVIRRRSENERLGRWGQILQAKGVNVVHRSGKHMSEVDALSRYPLAPREELLCETEALDRLLEGYSLDEETEDDQEQREEDKADHAEMVAVLTSAAKGGERLKEDVPEAPSYKEIVDQQRQDREIDILVRYLSGEDLSEAEQRHYILRRAKECKVVDGALYLVDEEQGKPRLWVPEGLQGQLVAALHHLSGHFGTNKTMAEVARRYYWVGLKKAVKEYNIRCKRCAERRAGGFKVPQVKTVQSSRPWELVSIDIVGPLPESISGNRYVLTLIDHFTRLADGIAVKRKDAETVAKALLNLIHRHGAPERLLTDRGMEFQARLTKVMLEELGIRGVSTSGYYPQCNGKVERMHRTLGNVLSHLVNKDHTDWDEQLPAALFAYNTKRHDETKETPFFLNRFREARQPWEDLPEVSGSNQSVKEFKTRLVERAARTFREVRARADAQAEQIAIEAERVKPLLESLKVGDLVMVKIGQRKGKFGDRFRGPARIAAVKNDGVNYELDWPDGSVTRPHLEKLKRFHGEAPKKWSVRKGSAKPEVEMIGIQKLRNRRRAKVTVDEEELISGEQRVVERIVGDRWHSRSGRRQFRVRWQGLTEAGDTWEFESNLEGCKAEINDHLQRQKSKRGARGRK